MTTPENPDWKKVRDELPEYRRNQALVLIKTAGENISKGMFFYNGSQPTFVSYGSNITSAVTEWAYANK